jgi:hypothetical protein
LIQEYDQFGATTDYHMLDALAQGPVVWTKPYGAARWADMRAAEQQLLDNRDDETGY